MVFNRGNGFNRIKFNSDKYSNVLYSIAPARSVSSGNAIAEIAYYVTAVSKTQSSTDVSNAIYKVLTMVFSGDLPAGKRVCINGIDFTVTTDGVNSIDSFTGSFPVVIPTTCVVTYSDSVGSRSAKIIVSRRDRSI